MADTFTAGGLRIERRHDRWNGTSYMAWKPHVSMLFTDTKELLRFIAWPKKTPTGDALREWLNSPTAELESTSIASELVASGVGPDPEDPNFQTHTII